MRKVEFIIKGPPVGVNAKEHSKSSRSKYRKWREAVADVAAKSLPDDWAVIESSAVVVHIKNYHAGNFHDVDNVIKPIFDGMNGVVFGDDNQVRLVSSERINVLTGITDPSEIVIDYLDRYDEFVHVIIEWEDTL